MIKLLDNPVTDATDFPVTAQNATESTGGKLTSLAGKMWDIFKGGAGAVVKGITSGLKVMGSVITGGIKVASKAAGYAWKGIKAVAGAYWSAIKGAFSVAKKVAGFAWKGIKAAAGALWSGICLLYTSDAADE